MAAYFAGSVLQRRTRTLGATHSTHEHDRSGVCRLRAPLVAVCNKLMTRAQRSGRWQLPVQQHRRDAFGRCVCTSVRDCGVTWRSHAQLLRRWWRQFVLAGRCTMRFAPQWCRSSGATETSTWHSYRCNMICSSSECPCQKVRGASIHCTVWLFVYQRSINQTSMGQSYHYAGGSQLLWRSLLSRDLQQK